MHDGETTMHTIILTENRFVHKLSKTRNEKFNLNQDPSMSIYRVTLQSPSNTKSTTKPNGFSATN